jgi:hypothetical protein
MYRKVFPVLEIINCVFPVDGDLEKLIFYASNLVPVSTARAFLPTGQLPQAMERQDGRQDFLTAIMGKNNRNKTHEELSWDILYINALFSI